MVRLQIFRLAHTLTGQPSRLEGGFSPEGGCWPAGRGRTRCGGWDPATGKPVRTLTGHNGAVTGGGGQHPTGGLASGGDRLSTRGIFPGTPALTGQQLGVCEGRVQPDGRLLARLRQDGAAVGPGHRHRAHPDRPRRSQGVVFSPDGRLLAPRGTRRCGCGTRPPASPRTLTGHTGPRSGVQPRRAAAGQQRRRQDGAAMGPGHRQAARTLTGHSDRSGGGVQPRRAAAGRPRRQDGAAVGPGHRQARAHPDRPHVGRGSGV